MGSLDDLNIFCRPTDRLLGREEEYILRVKDENPPVLDLLAVPENKTLVSKCSKFNLFTA